MHNRKATVHSIKDLEVRYDGQPPDIGGTLREDAGFCMKLIKLINNASNNFDYFSCASCGISEEIHGSKNE